MARKRRPKQTIPAKPLVLSEAPLVVREPKPTTKVAIGEYQGTAID